MTNIEQSVSVKPTGSGESPSELVYMSNEARAVLEIIFGVAVYGPVSVLGTTANAINIIIFIKQGFNDSVNVSFCALAVADIGTLLPLLWNSICFNPLFRYSDIGFDSSEFSYIGGLQHSCFCRITSWITAFITFERCVCIALPMKVKTIITPKRAVISFVAMFFIIYAISMPLFSTIYFGTTFHNETNKTIVGLKYTSDSETLGNISFSLNVFAQLSAFIIAIICTGVMILKLLTKSQWRRKATYSSSISDPKSSRDKRVMKTVMLISIIFIICYLPTVINLILMVHFSSEYNVTGRYINFYYASWTMINSIEGINSSTTIIVYYKTSSKFKTNFNELFNAGGVTVKDN